MPLLGFEAWNRWLSFLPFDMATRRLFLISVFLLLVFNNCRATDATKLTGSSITVEDATKKADMIFVGRIVEIGSVVPIPVSHPALGAVFHGLKAKSLQVFRGSPGAEITATIFVGGLNDHEELPTQGSTYVIFAKKNQKVEYSNPDALDVLKLLPASDRNLTAIQKLISNHE